MVQEGNQWRAHVNTVMKFRVLLRAGDFLTSWGTISFSRLYFIELISF
jgi:hypothetical protein